MKNPLRYYVYAYIGNNGLPYYIGKGCDNRAYAKHKSTSVPDDKSKIIFLERNLTEIGALAIERRMVDWYERKNKGGILDNISPGGDSPPSQKGAIVSVETRKKLKISGKKAGKIMSDRMKGKTLEQVYGKEKAEQILKKRKENQTPRKGLFKRSEEWKKKRSELYTGRKLPSYVTKKIKLAHKKRSEQKLNVGENNPASKKYLVKNPEGHVFFVNSIQNFCNSIGRGHGGALVVARALAHGERGYHTGRKGLWKDWTFDLVDEKIKLSEMVKEFVEAAAHQDSDPERLKRIIKIIVERKKK
jgi:hypothetical protein